jgi:hypothetical protein
MTRMVRRRALVVLGLTVLLSGVSAAAQTNRFAGRWHAAQADQGVVVTVVIGTSSSLTIPGVHANGTTEPLTLPIHNLMVAGDRATFSVDLPQNEGRLDLEFRIATATNAAALRVVRVDGESADDDVPTWVLRRAD